MMEGILVNKVFAFIISGGRVKFSYQKEDSKWDWTLKGKCCLSKGLIVYEKRKNKQIGFNYSEEGGVQTTIFKTI